MKPIYVPTGAELDGVPVSAVNATRDYLRMRGYDTTFQEAYAFHVWWSTRLGAPYQFIHPTGKLTVQDIDAAVTAGIVTIENEP